MRSSLFVQNLNAGVGWSVQRMRWKFPPVMLDAIQLMLVHAAPSIVGCDPLTIVGLSDNP